LAAEFIMTEIPASVEGKTSIREAAPGVQAVDVEAVNAKESRTLYASRVPIYPKLAHGKFRTIRWIILAVTLGIYYILPWIRWDRGPGLPNQGFLLDFAHQRMYFFNLELWAQDLYFITGVLVVSALGLFLVTALAGRVWCGYACPQTVWTDLMIGVEHIWQGDRNNRIRLAKSPWTFEKIWKKSATYFSWFLIALATGGAFVFYFADAPSLAYHVVHLEAPMITYVFIAIFTATTFVLGGMAREQVCTYMCPWPRIQGAMFDVDSLLVTYRGFRGEPRGPHKRGESWEGRGDCIDCRACIAVCPAGIDIRHGPQLECIQCALCIDACDDIMKKVGRPTKLIAYDSFRNLDAESHGQLEPFRFIRPRTILYTTVIAVVCAIMLWGLSRRAVLELNVLPDRSPIYVELSGGGIHNGYTVHILNKTHDARTFRLTAEGLSGAKVTAVGFEGMETLEVPVPPDEVRTLKVYIALKKDDLAKLTNGSTTFAFKVLDLKDQTEKQRSTNFRRP
jgi:cytochrome c oxidase accessory protein FixG